MNFKNCYKNSNSKRKSIQIRWHNRLDSQKIKLKFKSNKRF